MRRRGGRRCVCGKMACVCVCVWVCDKVSDDVMNKDERDEREREKEAEREVWRLWILRSDPHETFKRNTLETTIKAIRWSYPDHGGQC